MKRPFGGSTIAALEAVMLAPCLFAALQPAPCASFPAASLERASCLARQRNWKEAAEAYRTYLSAHAGSVPAALGEIEALEGLENDSLSRRDMAAAVRFAVEASNRMRELLEAHPRDPAVLKAYASRLALNEKDPAGAERALLEATRVAPGDADAWSLLGSFYLDSGRAADGIRCFERAAALDPSSPLCRAGLARGYAVAGRTEDARKAFATAVEAAGPHPNPAVFLWYGDFLAAAEKYAESADAYSHAIEADPAASEARVSRAAVELKAGRYREAERDALDALARGAPQRTVQALLMRVYDGLGEPEKREAASLALGRAADAEEELRGKWLRARSALDKAEALMQTGRFAQALPLYAGVISEMPEYPDAWLAAGVCQSQAGDAARAEQSFRAYLRLQPQSAEGHTALGVLLLAGGRLPEAKAEFREALRLDPDSAEAREALAAAER